ncbi:MAG: anthranilate synthase component I [Phenylobacterium sp.]|uniref:anthranilate synthase component I n=1 Tax=Phenylobacterium sp. TaxID=1871053 RepID=UPI002718E725|nr:anthranilate synthase component I [Phenylobacterium sp.]MDO8901581.1 anthranilate synthase component I [Phenylobacterium sp.]MDP2213138.1 anthranilate synthase component I [Phenylobacterium sp.]
MSLEPAFDDFAPRYAAGAAQVVWTRLIDDLETPVSAYLKIAQGQPYAFLFESVEGGAWRGRYSVITLKPDLVWRCRGETAELAEGHDIAAGRFTTQTAKTLDSLRDLVASARLDIPPGLPPMVAGVFGALGYDMVRLVERLPDVNPDPLGLPDGIMTRPSIVAIFDSIGQEIILATTVRPGPETAQAAYDAAKGRLAAVMEDLRRPAPGLTGTGVPTPDAFTTPISREAYREIVEKAKGYIRAGDIFQVVPSHRFRAPFPLDPLTLYRSLRRTNPSPFLFYLNFGDFQLAGSSPEILVRLRDGKITIRPIAGTRPRGATPEEDLALEQELIADPKERAEHLMLLDLGRNDVGRVAMLRQPGRNAETQRQKGPAVRVTDSFFVERYSHVMHLVSNVEGDAPEGVDPVDVLMAALPAGTLSGAPKVRAMQIIDELEIEKRGVAYAGAVGYFGADGSVDTCIVLRTACFKDGQMYIQAGGGVVADSDPDAEYDETLHKARALRRAAEDAWRFV